MMSSTKNQSRTFSYSKTIILFGLFCSAIYTAHIFAAPSSSYNAIPPFVAENSGKPNVIIALDISGSMKAVAYRDTGAGNWKTGLHDDFDPAKKYFGYFESDKKYTFKKLYDFFVEDATGSWDGNFLNWLAMRRMDIVRKVLVGGKIKDRAGEVFGGNTYFVLEGHNEPYDYSFRKSYIASSAYTPFPDGQEFTIAEGKIKPTTSANANAVAISAELEVGRATMNWDIGNPLWLDVEFVNTYTSPVVVAHSVSYKGGDPTVVRIKDIGAAIGSNGGFRIRLQEWDYRDGNHTTEDIIYMVAEQGNHSVALDASKTLEFSAGTTVTDRIVGIANTFEPVAFTSALSATPVVFAGVSTYNEVDAVTVRMQNITAGGLEVAMQEQELNPELHANESIHYIAIVPVTGITTADSIPVEVGKTGNLVGNSWYTVNFATSFPAPPLIALAAQTFNGSNTASVRYGNAVIEDTSVDIQMDEEKSLDNEVSHVAEDVAYFATLGVGISIRLGVAAEPTGIVQDNSGGMRFGLAVYNYDHTKSPSSMYNGNQVDGGTLYPCYPDINVPLSTRTNYDVCLETHVKSPISNIITVIEDHPLIWGTTPIAETLYEIYGYVNQKNNARNSHDYFYDNGTEVDFPPASTPNYPSYKISNDWDPYYYTEYGQKMKCAKTFVLHFNDGAPYRDWDNTNPTSIGSLSPITDGVGSTAAQEMLDDVAFAVRNQDCRSDMDEHQEIISYYVYAALGEGEINNTSTKRMRESAANGGFVDDDGDKEPDPAHPTNFVTYYQNFLDGGTCTPNEWDDDGDCNPDTFYLANNGYELVTELTAAFDSIKRRASSGGAASVISASSSGEGAIYQALFHTTMSNSTFNVKWTGDVHGLFIDAKGLIHEDDGDKTLEDSSIDNILDMCFDKGAQTVRIKRSASEGVRPTSTQQSDCSGSIFANTLFDISYLWSGGEWLRDLTNGEALAQTTFPRTAGSKSRYIISGIDTDADGLISSTEQVNFSASSFSSTFGLLQAADATEAGEIVNYIRGKDQAGYRSRQIDAGKTWRLGDVVYSTPTPYGRPAENLHLLYFDLPTVKAEYIAYKKQYNNRRQVVFAGSNDGVLHAFNGGWYKASEKKYQNGPTGKVQMELGTELWAYVPYNMLPHLKHISDPSYGSTTGSHIYGVDLQPRIFDAKIFADDADHPDGWGSVLVGGMRFGGGEITTAGVTMRSSFFILDITNPEVAPKLLLEFTDPNLGFTTSSPAPFVHDGKFYLLLGSGPTNSPADLVTAASTQNAKLFLIDLHTMKLDTVFGGGTGIITLPDANSFVSDLTAIDYNLDYNASSIYFGTVSGASGAWGGKLYRIQTQLENGTNVARGSWAPTVLINAGAPIVAKPASSIDENGNRWIFAGTGRYFTRFDAVDTSPQKMFGVKEPRNTSGDLTWATAIQNNMVNVSNAEVEQVTAALTGVVSGTTSLSLPLNPSFYDLDSAMQKFDSNHVDGWYRNLTLTGNRVIGEATIFGSTLNHTSYRPSAAVCTVDGTAELHVNYFTTGTASAISIVGTKSTNGSNGHPLIESVIEIGSTPALSPSLHTGQGYETDKSTKAFIQTSDGKITEIKQQNNDAVRSGESSWRLYY